MLIRIIFRLKKCGSRSCILLRKYKSGFALKKYRYGSTLGNKDPDPSLGNMDFPLAPFLPNIWKISFGGNGQFSPLGSFYMEMTRGYVPIPLIDSNYSLIQTTNVKKMVFNFKVLFLSNNNIISK